MSEEIKLSGIHDILSNIGNKLIQNQPLLKCLKYDSSDALSKPKLTSEEIIELVENEEKRRIYRSPFNKQVVDEARTELRVFFPEIIPQNIYLARLTVVFEIIVHESLWELDNNKDRPLIMIGEILKELNGEQVGGIGKFYLIDSIKAQIFNADFTGYIFNMATRTD